MLQGLRQSVIETLSRPRFDSFTESTLSAILRARGFNNHGNFRESGEEWFIKSVLAPHQPTLCIDVGANLGMYAKLLLRETAAQVICFEPVASTFDQLSAELSSYQERVILHRAGLGHQTTAQNIYFNPDATEHASFSRRIENISYVSNSNSESVELMTLDDYCAMNSIGRIDFIKVDTEGYEFEVLSGAKETISELRPQFIQLEFNLHQLHRGHSLLALAELLQGYDLFQLTPSGMRQRNPRSALSNFYAYSNFVFVRR